MNFNEHRTLRYVSDTETVSARFDPAEGRVRGVDLYPADTADEPRIEHLIDIARRGKPAKSE